jgi:hypothetical protein
MLFGNTFEARESLECPRPDHDQEPFRQRNSNLGSDDHAANFSTGRILDHGSGEKFVPSGIGIDLADKSGRISVRR